MASSVHRTRMESFDFFEPTDGTIDWQLDRLITDLNNAIATYKDGIPEDLYASFRDRMELLLAEDIFDLADKQAQVRTLMELAADHVQKKNIITLETIPEIDEAAEKSSTVEKRKERCCNKRTLVAASVGLAAIATATAAYWQVHRLD